MSSTSFRRHRSRVALATVVSFALCLGAAPAVSQAATTEPTPTDSAPATEPGTEQTPAESPDASPTTESSPAPDAESASPSPEESQAPLQDAAPSPSASIAPVKGSDGNAANYWPLAITEINGDNKGADNYEYVEVTNTTSKPINLTDEGIQLRYHGDKWDTGDEQPLIHLDGEDDNPAVIPAGGIAVFWMNYGEGNPRQAISKDKFREFYGVNPDVQVFRFGPQEGFRNAGERGFSLTDKTGKTLSRAWVPADDKNASTPWNAQFAVPNETDSVDARLTEYDITGATAQPSPGTITQEQVTSSLTKPATPEPEPSSSPEPTTPVEPGELLNDAPVLQITEVAPDTANVNGSDAFEFIEVYNASNEPVNFGDYVLSYLNTDNALTGPNTVDSTLWPAGPTEPVIQPGHALVLWVNNPAVETANYTAADFNKAFGTNLVLGENLLTIHSPGMANGGARGLQLMTKSGHDVSRAYYFNDDQTTASTAIQYAWNPSTEKPAWAPADRTKTVQTMLGLAKPSPGTVTDDQKPSAPVAFPAAGTAPVIVDRTAGSEHASTEGLKLAFSITDDTLVRRVTLTTKDNLGATQTRNLTVESGDEYPAALAAVDLYGKQWIEYSVVASDGHQPTSFGPVRVPLNASGAAALRLNVAENQYVRGQQVPLVATANEGTEGLGVSVDDAMLEHPRTSLERAPKFAIEATATDAFFRNGIKLGDNVLKIFDEGYYDRIVTVDADVPVGDVIPGQPLTLSVHSGTKAWPNADLNENNDDFTMMAPRLALPDGRVLQPTRCEGEGEKVPRRDMTCPATSDQRINLSDNDLVTYYATFTIPADAFNSVSTMWDSTTVADGTHQVTATRAAESVSRSILVDNTAPIITATVQDGKQYRGDFSIDASATDRGSGVDTITATLDGNTVELPHTASSLNLAPGTHTVAVTATDKIGNASTKTVTFTTPDETPRTRLITPENGATVKGSTVQLAAVPESNADDALEVCFAEGYSFNPESAQVTSASGTTTNARSTDRSDATPLSEQDLAKVAGTDGLEFVQSSANALPYQLFTVDVPKGANKGSDARVQWNGSANADAKVLMYVQTAAGRWEEVDRYVTTGGAATTFTLDAQVPVEGHEKHNKLTFLVQHSEGWAATDLSTRDSAVTPFNAGATPRSAYDFTLAWESDTQYYNKNEDKRAGTGGADTWYQHQVNIHDFVLRERKNLNLQYMTHTGDIVDDQNQQAQWDNANDAYTKLDKANFPYGVLAGNHDVGHFEGNYGPYGTYFGESRFDKNPWYGGSYKNNRGHYDLVSVDGVDLVMVYMGWPDPNNEASNTQDINWLNSVIKQYPERKVMLNLHEYMLTTGGLGPFPQRVFNEVVKPNANVIAVGSGHYHDAYTRTDEFDDNGDGIADRTVYSMLFDYQGLPEGGQGFLRLLHFDNVGGKIMVRTYSPSLDKFNSDEASLNDPAGMQEFEIPYAAGGIAPMEKRLATDSFTTDILTSQTTSCDKGVKSGDLASATWKNLSKGEHSWYVRTTGPYGGVSYSEVRTFTTVPVEGGGTGPGGNANAPGDNNAGGGNAPAGDGEDASAANNAADLAHTGGTLMLPLLLSALLALATGGVLLRTRRGMRQE